MIPEIDNKFEKFDNDLYDELSMKNHPNITPSDSSYIEIARLQESRYFNTSKDSYFTIVKLYHQNFNIKKKGLGFNVAPFTFKKGVWYEFDEQGNLIKETDYDQPFTFTFEDILKFCEKHGIKIDIGPILPNTGWHNDIFRDIQNGKPIWRIEHLKKTNLVEVIKIDGVTGKVLET
ncbi:hypothetical protein, partial [Chryseobacterium vrystaatense]